MRHSIISKAQGAFSDVNPETYTDDYILHFSEFDWYKVLEESKRQPVVVYITPLKDETSFKYSEAFGHIAKLNKERAITFIKITVSENTKLYEELNLPPIPVFRIIMNKENPQREMVKKSKIEKGQQISLK